MEYIEICCIVYLDDVLLYSRTRLGQQQDVKHILEAIQKSGMKIKPSKCELHKKETESFGLITGEDGIRVDPVKTEALWDWTTSKTKKEIQ